LVKTSYLPRPCLGTLDTSSMVVWTPTVPPFRPPPATGAPDRCPWIGTCPAFRRPRRVHPQAIAAFGARSVSVPIHLLDLVGSR
jgi:hypothetical protein